MTRPFVDNFIFFDSYPVDKLSLVEQWLDNNQLDDFYRNDDFGRNPMFGDGSAFYGTKQILFPKFIFYNKNYTDEWQDLCTIIEPLIAFMQDQISAFGTYQPKQVELNIMPPGTVIKPHVDNHLGVGEDYRMHIVIDTNEAVEFIVEDRINHLTQGTCFAFDNSKMHSVTNGHDSVSRIHLVVDFKLAT
jgi:hypothetical protein